MTLAGNRDIPAIPCGKCQGKQNTTKKEAVL